MIHIGFMSSMDDDVGLHCPHPTSNRGIELRSPCHPVLSRQHGT